MTGTGNISGHTDSNYKAPAPELSLLIRDCIANERAAQKQLYDTYSPTLYAVIRRYVDDLDTAKEVLNDTFYKVFTRLSQYSFHGAFEGWLRQIAVNIISDHFRRNKKHEVITGQDVETIDAHVNNDIVGKISYKELLQLIHELPTTQKAVFNLYVFENYPHKDIAELLGITENNSRWQLNDARRRLKEKIKNIM
ncbi:MAG: sigma-70 family RNA polymerase sigma factor [Taibaiella sp.]|nr:sigma-70 family RNA polymerase sigma factor [Taibaiella sp.]